MISHNWQIMKHLAKFYDLLAMVVAFITATVLLYEPGDIWHLEGFFAVKVKLWNVLLFGMLLAAWHNLFILCGLYTSKRLTPRTSQLSEVCKATTFAAIVLFVTANILHITMVTWTFVLLMWGLCTLMMLAGRLIARGLLVSLRKRGRNTRHLLIIGTNPRAVEFAEGIQSRPELGYSILGFVDEDWEGTFAFEETGHQRCCTFSGLAEFLRHNVVDEAAMYLPLRSYYEHASQLVELCEEHGIVVRTDLQIFTLKRQDQPMLDLDSSSQIMAVASSIRTWPALVKRVFDFIVSLWLLVVLSPVLCAVALVIRLTSEGPILFRQTRVGLNKRHFRIYKFRTMIPDAERVQDQLLSQNEMSGPVFKIKYDPRVTPVGRFLRKTSLDELPQLFNVLTGEMSLVGPRAMSLRDYKLFDQDAHRRRFSVKPGITCLWQVCGRNSIPFDQWMELDLQYIDRWSIWLDMKILAQTVPAVLRGTGAA